MNEGNTIFFYLPMIFADFHLAEFTEALFLSKNET
jgi:hypothetical protein